MAKLSPGIKLSAVIRNKIEQMKKETEAEVKQAKNFLDDVAQSGNKVFNSSFPNLNNVSIK